MSTENGTKKPLAAIKCFRYGSGMDNAHTKLRAWLADEGRMQMWLAAKLGVKKQTVNAWCMGRVTPTPTLRTALQAVTGIPASDWVDLTKSPAASRRA